MTFFRKKNCQRPPSMISISSRKSLLRKKLFVLFTDAHPADPDADPGLPSPHPGADPLPGHPAHPDAGSPDRDDHLGRRAPDPEPGHLPPEPHA